jgi:glycine/serine hydroxymethyltransferase
VPPSTQPGTANNTTVIVQTVAGSDGSFHAVVPTPPGQSILTVTVTAGGHATSRAQQAVTGNYSRRSSAPRNAALCGISGSRLEGRLGLGQHDIEP